MNPVQPSEQAEQMEHLTLQQIRVSRKQLEYHQARAMNWSNLKWSMQRRLAQPDIRVITE
ncbi:hypothetical protein [Sphaerotilus sp.]|uniref:hypothetical protein n=1 Tax=Sphaerotilus sp. TaxID=2093942 RepID=UPI0034E27C5D